MWQRGSAVNPVASALSVLKPRLQAVDTSLADATQDEYLERHRHREEGTSGSRRGRIRRAGTLGFPSTFQGAEAMSPWAVLRPKRTPNS